LAAASTDPYSTTNGREVSISQKSALLATMLDYDLVAAKTYNGAGQSVSVALKAAYSGLGAITVLYDGAATLPINVGTYNVSINAASGANFEAVTNFALGQVNITPAPLTIHPNDVSLVYGNPIPTNFAVTFSTLRGADTQASITDLMVTTTALATSPVGTYLINASGATNPNYAYTYVPGILTITAAPTTKLPQTIMFASLPTLYVGGSPYKVDAGSTVNLPLSFSSSDPSVATISADGYITPIAVGTTIITAYNAGDATYESALTSRTLVVQTSVGNEIVKESQVITVYPNPVSHSAPVYVSADMSESLLTGAVIAVYSESGSLVKNVPVTGKLTRVDLSVHAGTYLFVLKGKTGIIETLKVIVK
jgi:hypothetical protein